MEFLLLNPLPRFDAPTEEFAPLAYCLMSTVTRRCVYCDQGANYGTYSAYLSDYAATYEGPFLSGPYAPEDEDMFEYLESACRAS